MQFPPFLTLYKAQIRPGLEYGSHLWRGASKHSLATLDAIQKREIKLIGDPALTNSLDSLAHRRTISALSQYYRYYHGVCSVELKSIIPPKALFTTPSLSNWIKIEQALSPTLLSLWPPETGTHFQPPSSPRLITFSCLRPASTDTFNSYPAHKISLFFFFSRWRDQRRPLWDAPFRCISFSHQYHKKKKKFTLSEKTTIK